MTERDVYFNLSPGFYFPKTHSNENTSLVPYLPPSVMKKSVFPSRCDSSPYDTLAVDNLPT